MRYYSNNYAVVEDYDFINITQLNEQIIEKLNLSDKNQYLIFKYKITVWFSFLKLDNTNSIILIQVPRLTGKKTLKLIMEIG